MVPVLRPYIERWDGAPWVEPFVGGGGFTELIGRHRSKIVLGEIDFRVAAWWEIVAGDLQRFNRFMDRLGRTEPSLKLHAKLARTPENATIFRAAFAGILLNRMSFSGILDGSGPIGGRNQETATYKVGCRFNPERIIPQHWAVRNVVFGATVVRDFAEALAFPGLAVCDPPYVTAGGRMYRYAFDEAEHKRLAAELEQRRDPWVLTYDDHPLIHELYAGCQIDRVPARYTVRSSREDWKDDVELVITPALTL